MKLKDSFVTQQIGDTVFLLSVGGEDFGGMVRCNSTAAFLVELLKREQTEEELIDAMCRNYDAPREVIAADAEEMLRTLRSIRALEEGDGEG